MSLVMIANEANASSFVEQGKDPRSRDRRVTGESLRVVQTNRLHDLVQSRSSFSFFPFFLSSVFLSPLLPSLHSNYGTVAPRVDPGAPLSDRQPDRSPGILEQLRREMSCNALAQNTH